MATNAGIDFHGAGGSATTYEETPGGTVNGSNAAFTLSHAPNPAVSLLLFNNGILQKRSNDYTLAGTAITFLAGAIPSSGDSITANYSY